MALGWDLARLPPPRGSPPPLAEGSLGRTRQLGTWGRRCRGVHGSAGLVGAILAPHTGFGVPHPWGRGADGGGPQSRRVWQEWGKMDLHSILVGGEQRFCHPTPKGGSTQRCCLQPRSRVMGAHPGHGGESRSAQQPRAARASHPPHVPENVTCGRPLGFSHTFSARTPQTKAFPGYSCFCLKG